jgi:hypothetical protein
MNSEKKTATTLEDVKINVKIKLSALWVAVTLCYLYGDFWGLYKPGLIEEIIAGEVAGMQITQVWLLGLVILMVSPSIMVFLSLTLKVKANRWANIILGIFYTCFMLYTMLMPGVWAYYIFLGIVEVVLTVLIVWYAWKWPKQEG